LSAFYLSFFALKARLQALKFDGVDNSVATFHSSWTPTQGSFLEYGR